MVLRLTARVALARGPVYNAGDVAGFSDDIARQLLAEGLAVLDEPHPSIPHVTAVEAPPRAAIVTRARESRKTSKGPVTHV